MQTDGNLISTGAGDGSAHLVQPFAPDQTPFIERNKVLAVQQAQRGVERKKQEEDRRAAQDAWVKEMRGNHKYDPADRPVVQREQQKLLGMIEKYDGSPEQKFAIDDQQIALGKFIKDSSDGYDQYLKAAADRRINGDNVYYKNEDKLESSRVVNNSETLEDAFGVLGTRMANIQMFGQEEPKIKDVPNFLALEVTKLKPTSYETEQVATPNGYISTPRPKYDQAALKNLSGLLYDTHRSIREHYKDKEAVYQAMLPYQTKTEKPIVKGNTSAAGSKIVTGGGTVTSGNVVFSPPQKFNYTDTGQQVASYESYEKGMKEAVRKAPSETQKATIRKGILSKQDYEKKFPYTSTVDAIPFSIKGMAENSPHQFTVVVGGKEIQVDGQTNLYDASTNSFLVQTGGDKPMLVKAPVEKNKQFLTDAGLTIEDFNKAIAQVRGGNVVKTDASGKVVSSQKEVKITPAEFNKQWAKLKPGDKLVGPDGVTYVKK